MKTRILFGIIALSSLIFSCNNKIEYGQFTEAICPINIPEELAASGKFFYGYMTVPEFHNKPGSKAIELAIAVFKCRNDSALSEPLILTSGGPGQSNIDDFIPSIAGPVGDLFLNERDIVVIELRGLKYSRPNLNTPELNELQVELLDKNINYEEAMSIYIDTVRSIHKRLTDAGVDLSAYNYWESASDLVFVMEQLGYEKFFLFGTSAGTIVAQYLLMDHSDHISGLVLNAVVNIEPGFNDMYVHTIEKLDRIFTELEQDETYSKAYPDLKNRFLHTFDELNESPETLSVKIPGQDLNRDIVFNGNRLAVWLFGQMYWNTQLPLSMHKIINRDFTEIIQNPGTIFPLQSFSNGSFWSMVMNSWPDPSLEQLPLDGEYKTFLKGTSTMVFGSQFTKQIREIWGVDYVSGRLKPMATNVPALIMNGEEDHLCLYQYAQELSDSFETSYCYIFKGVAHSPIDAGPCGIMLMKQFLDNPYSEPDASCLETVKNEYALPSI